MKLTERQLAAILAGLRLLQKTVERGVGPGEGCRV